MSTGKLAIVNPYVKKEKKPAPPHSQGTCGRDRCLSSKQSSGNHSVDNPHSDHETQQLMTSIKNATQSAPSRSTPIGEENKDLHVSCPTIFQQGWKNSSNSDHVPISTSARSIQNKRHSAKRSSKSKLSVKQRLKQEILALKKQKQLQKLQKEAEERRRRRTAEKKIECNRRRALLAAKEEERRQKRVERERLAVMKQEEMVRKQRERERNQHEKEQERERKRENKLRKEQERQKIIEEQRQKSESKYQRECQAWTKHQQCWIEHQQRIRLFQQARQWDQQEFNCYIPSERKILPDSQNQQYHRQQLQIQTEPMLTSLPPVSPRTDSPDLNFKDASLDKDFIPKTTKQTELSSSSLTSSTNPAKLMGFDHFVPFPAITTNMNLTATTTNTCSNVVRLPQPPDEHLSFRSDLVPPSPMTSLQSKVLQQDDRRLVSPSSNLLHSSMFCGSVFPYHSTMPNQAKANTSHSSPTMNSTVLNYGKFALPASFSWIPPPPPPPITTLRQPKVLCRVVASSKRRKSAKQSFPSLLCNPMEAPSPFANQGRHLVTVMVIRDPRTEKTYGINLKFHTESTLVDPQWLEAQRRKEGINSKADEKSDITKKVETKHLSASKTINLATPAGDNSTTVPSTTLVAAQRAVITNCQSLTHSSAENPTINVCDHFTIKGRSIGNVPENEKSLHKIDLIAPKKNLSYIRINPRTDDYFENNSNNEVKKIVESCLEYLVNSVVTRQNVTERTASNDATSAPILQKRKRRRRVNFSVMQVVDADKQNIRRPDIDPQNKLQPGDIVVSVQGHHLNGMAFKDACGVFSKNQKCVSDSLIHTEVVVARKKPNVDPVAVTGSGNINPIPLGSVQIPSHSKTPDTALPIRENTSMVFSPSEIALMSNCFFQTLHSSDRVLGQGIQDSAWHIHTTIFRMGDLLKNTELSARAPNTLEKKWSHLTKFTDHNLVEKGKTFWTQKFREEFGDENIPFSSDVERHAMRHLPRPSKGCRCKQQNHEYLFDPKCVLYRNLRKRLSKEELTKLQHQKKISKSVPNKDFNVVESAFKNRILKVKETKEKELIEARFVEKMEDIQVRELHQAIFAPSLTTIILSAVFELKREFFVSIEEDHKNIIEDAENDDDVTLDCLGKRKPEDQPGGDRNKKTKVGGEGYKIFNLKYMIRILEYASKTWGHCYREPERDDYAWRWELFHAVHSDFDRWDAYATNPRVPGSYPFENLRFGLSDSKRIRTEVSSVPKTLRQFEDSIISSSHLAFELSDEVLNQFCLVVHLLSPCKSGLYDEMLAMLKMGIFKISPSGIPVFTEDWWTKIDFVVLDEMNSSWSTKIDPDSKHCVNEELRDILEEKWVKSDHGWSLVENPRELIYDFAILDEWRETFEGRLEEKADLSEGIGRFGL